MQRKIAFATIAVAGLATAASAQIRLSHNIEEFVVTAGAGVACATRGTSAPQTTTDNLWSRSFTLADFGVTDGFDVNQVEFGVESIRLPTLIETEITVNLYQVPAGSPPIAGAPLVGSASLTTGDRALEVLTIDIDGQVDAGTALMVEVESEDLLTLAGGETGDVFFIGGNSFGQNAPSYIASPIGCGLPDPTDVATFGFTDSHFIIIAVGEEGGGLGVPGGPRRRRRPDDLRLPDLPEPLRRRRPAAPTSTATASLTIFDFLAFQNAFDAGC
ncbi:MAG: hypothetical protein KatS3mg103_1266 [Phycisphaerales bacterium]|nr:MAG: hypothetical protein KatS3mg103_1266 [Phycisphaerales bacterium]